MHGVYGMDRSDIVTLISSTEEQDEYGVLQETNLSGRDVPCQVESVTRAEFFEGGRNGLNPEFRIKMFFGNYNGEKTLLYHGRIYAIYRTYIGRNDIIELYVERKGGTNGKKNQTR